MSDLFELMKTLQTLLDNMLDNLHLYIYIYIYVILYNLYTGKLYNIYITNIELSNEKDYDSIIEVL